jgi:hypothetical protein
MSADSRLSRVAVLVFAGLLSVLGAGGARCAELTPTEQRWLQGAWPVIAYAKQARLPLDVVVQPQATPDNPPLSTAFVDGRCKLVLSMRGNPQAQATLDAIEPALLDVTLELMAAHELGHCRRYLDGAWFQLPVGFAAGAESNASLEAAPRREEGYGDLVGLAWTQSRHPELYLRLHAWLLNERSSDRVPGSAHDTVAWVQLAQDPAMLGRGELFDAPKSLWIRGAVAPVAPRDEACRAPCPD